jgi:hypothetical protein
MKLIDGSFSRRSLFYIGLLVLFSLALTFSVASARKSRQDVQAVTVANETLRKTLGEMTIAIAEKDRQIDRLTRSDCKAGK